jgi:hypothetical protein
MRIVSMGIPTASCANSPSNNAVAAGNQSEKEFDRPNSMVHNDPSVVRSSLIPNVVIPTALRFRSDLEGELEFA